MKAALARILAAALALAAVALPAVAQSQFPQNLPANTLYGRLGIGSGPGQAIPLARVLAPLISEPNTFTALQTFGAGAAFTAPVTAINTVTPVSPSTPAFVINDLPVGLSFPDNDVHFALTVTGNKSGTGTGTWTAQSNVQYCQNMTTTGFCTALQASAIAVPGTGTNAGIFTGVNPQCIIPAGISNAACTAIEIDVISNSTLGFKNALRIGDLGTSDVTTNPVRFSVGVNIVKTVSPPAAATGYGFGSGFACQDEGVLGQFGIQAGGNCITIAEISGGAQMAAGIDMSAVVPGFSRAAIVLPKGIAGASILFGADGGGGAIYSLVTSNGGNVQFDTNTTTLSTGALTATVAGGVQVGSPTGGDKGAGTANLASYLYQNGSPVAAIVASFNSQFFGTGTIPSLSSSSSSGANDCSSGSIYGKFNFGAGEGAATSLTNACNTVAVGYQAANSAVHDIGITAVGAKAARLQNNGGGALGPVTALGYSACELGTTNSFVVCVGNSALEANTGTNNVAVGSHAGIGSLTGSSLTLVGDSCAPLISGLSFITCISAASLTNHTTSGGNITTGGYQSLFSDVNGHEIAAWGGQAFFNATQVIGGSAIGHSSCQGGAAFTVSYITCNGYNTGHALTGNNAGNASVFVGSYSGFAVTIGQNNTFVGSCDLSTCNSVTTGQGAITSGSGNLGIGYNVGFQSSTGNNQIVIQNTIFCTGADGTGYTASTNPLCGIKTTSPAYAWDVTGDINVSSGKGYLVNGGATSGHVLRGNGTRFVDAQLAFSDLSGTIATGQVSGSYTGITAVGTIATGTWQGTKVGLAYGGTNADLGATGGTSQVLKQVSSGAAVTVGQLAASDLSDTVAPTSWTPTDATGNSNLTAASGEYYKIGKLMVLTFNVTYKSGVSGGGSQASIGGVPVNFYSAGTAVVGGYVFHSSAVGAGVTTQVTAFSQDVAKFGFSSGAGSGTLLTNTNMDSSNVKGTIIAITN